MKLRYKLKFILLLIFVCHNLNAQTKSTICDNELNGFIRDSQEYMIKAQETTIYDVIFYPGFTYRLQLSTLNKNIKLELILVDEKGNLQFNNNISYGYFRDFKFETIFHGKIKIKALSIDSQPSQILIGYKKAFSNT